MTIGLTLPSSEVMLFFEGADAQDQRRTATPTDARRAGADFIVVGRPITRSADPGAAAQAIVREMRSELV